MIVILAAALALTLYNLGREIFYLRPGSRYWIEISSKPRVSAVGDGHGYEVTISPLNLRTRDERRQKFSLAL